MDLFVMVFLLVVVGPIAAVVARHRGYPVLGWFLLPPILGALALTLPVAPAGRWTAVALLSGILGLVLILLRPSTRDARDHQGLKSGTLRPCPHCAEPVQAVATTCSKCGKNISGIGGESTNEFMKRLKEQYEVEDESPS